MGRNGKSLMGIPWEWELVTKLGMGMGRNGNLLHGNGREWECKKPFPGISNSDAFVIVCCGAHCKEQIKINVGKSRIYRKVSKIPECQR